MNNINDKSPFNKMKGIFNNDIFKGNLKIMGKCGTGKSTLLFSLVNYNIDKYTQIVLINKFEEKEVRDLFKNYKEVDFINYQSDIDFKKLLLKNKNKTLFIIVDYFNYVFKEDEKAHEIIKKVNDNKDHEKIKLYLSEAHRSNFFELSKEYVRISRKSNIDYIFETQEFENCDDFEIKLVFSSLKKRGFGSAFYNLNVGEFKIIKNKKLIKLSSKELYMKELLKEF